MFRRVHGSARRERRHGGVSRAATAVRCRPGGRAMGLPRVPAGADDAARAGRPLVRPGRKLLYLYGFVVFAAASAGCGLATSIGMLIALRLVQAVGAAMLQANSVALVVTSMPARKRRAALGVQAAAQAVGLASGPVLGGLIVATVGWRWVFFLNVPVGVVAVAAGVFLLPRTRRRAESRGTDPAGMILLAVSTTAGMLAISSLSGLGLPAWAVACCAAGAVVAAATLWRQERRSAAPLLDLPSLAASGTARALCGALCSYLVLFGPLVLFPQVVSAQGGSALAAGLLLTSLPAGFGVAAVLGDRLLPAHWPNSRRCAVGGALASGCAAALAVPAPHPVSVVLLGLLGAGLGVYTPANNAEIMTALPAGDAAAAGGMVNMTRGIGTALGVAVVTIGLHVGTFLRQPDAGLTLSMAALAAVALVGVWCGQRGGRSVLSPAGEPVGRRQMAD